MLEPHPRPKGTLYYCFFSIENRKGCVLLDGERDSFSGRVRCSRGPHFAVQYHCFDKDNTGHS